MRKLSTSHHPSWLSEELQSVPLPLLASALTHREAGAEALELPPEPAPDAPAPDAPAADAPPLWRDAARMDARGCCDYEILELAGDAALDVLAKSCVMANHPRLDVNRLNPMAEELLRNKSLWRRAHEFSVPPLALFRPFEARARLPELTKWLVAPKQQADLMEAMMGAVCQAQIECNDASTRLARGLDAALAFFIAYVCPVDEVPRCPTSKLPYASSAELLRNTFEATMRRKAPAAGYERAGDIRAAFAPVAFERRNDLLLECCAWHEAKDGEDRLVFQRLELLGDAFLQCTRTTRARPPAQPPTRAHAVGRRVLSLASRAPIDCGRCCDDGASAALPRETGRRANVHALGAREQLAPRPAACPSLWRG